MDEGNVCHSGGAFRTSGDRLLPMKGVGGLHGSQAVATLPPDPAQRVHCWWLTVAGGPGRDSGLCRGHRAHRCPQRTCPGLGYPGTLALPGSSTLFPLCLSRAFLPVHGILMSSQNRGSSRSPDRTHMCSVYVLGELAPLSASSQYLQKMEIAPLGGMSVEAQRPYGSS